MTDSATMATANRGEGSTFPPEAKARRQSTAEALAASSELEEALVSPIAAGGGTEAPSSTPHDEAGAERARSATEAWKPAMNRRQSWSKEEHKHALQMSSIADVKTGPGFSERAQ